MKKNKFLLISMFLVPALSFAASNTVDMSNLKCGDMQVYSNTTTKQFLENCSVQKAVTIARTDNLNLPAQYWNGQKNLYEIQFNSTSQPGLIRCDFLNSGDEQVVLGCRNNY